MGQQYRITCTRRIQFCAGHRLLEHHGPCSNIHGHNYVAYFTAEAESLDGVGRVIDFSILKSQIGAWIDRYWDHGFIYFKGKDTEVETGFTMFCDRHGSRTKKYGLDANPTAENMARHLLMKVCPKVLSPYDVKVTKVVLWETENCYAEATL